MGRPSPAGANPPDVEIYKAASLRLVAAGWRRDPTVTAQVVEELTSTARSTKNVVLRQRLTIQILSRLVAAVVTTSGELLRSDDPIAALTVGLVHFDGREV